MPQTIYRHAERTRCSATKEKFAIRVSQPSTSLMMQWVDADFIIRPADTVEACNDVPEIPVKPKRAPAQRKPKQVLDTSLLGLGVHITGNPEITARQNIEPATKEIAGVELAQCEAMR